MTTDERDEAMALYAHSCFRAGAMMKAADPAEAVREVIDIVVGLVGYCERAKIDGPAVRDGKAFLARVFSKPKGE